MTLSEWQAAGNDPLTTASPYPDDEVVLSIAAAILGM